MKTLKLLLVHILFFVLALILTHCLKDYIVVKRIFLIVLFVGLSLYVYKYIYYSNKVLKAYLINLFGLFFFYEAMKISEYFFGLLPKYNEIPFISALGSLVCIALYLGFITFICHAVRIKRTPFAD